MYNNTGRSCNSHGNCISYTVVRTDKFYLKIITYFNSFTSIYIMSFNAI